VDCGCALYWSAATRLDGWVSELLGLKVRQVDLYNREVRLEPGTTKNREGRTAVMTENVFQLLKACVMDKKPDDYVFTRDGRVVRDFRGTWEAVTAEARVPDLLFHDLRRTAVRNMVRSGVPETVAMKISGHKTRSVFDRYNVTSAADLRDAARRLEFARVAQKTETIAVDAQPRSMSTQSSTLPS
jgi:integrase